MKLKVSILISASWPAWMNLMSWFDTMASISRRLSLGTHHQQRLRRRDDAANRVHGKLLHHAVHGAVSTCSWSAARP